MRACSAVLPSSGCMVDYIVPTLTVLPSSGCMVDYIVPTEDTVSLPKPRVSIVVESIAVQTEGAGRQAEREREREDRQQPKVRNPH